MVARLRVPLFLAVVAAMLIAAGYWNIRPQTFMQPTPIVGEQPDIDYYVEGSRTVQFQPDGSLHYVLTAERLEHLRSSDISLLTLPDLNLYRGGDIPWHVRSERGEVAPGGTEVELIDQVRIARTDQRGRPTIVTTSSMTVFPERDYAQTRQAVRIEAANGVTTAIGMNAYLDEGRMELLSTVRGQHELR
ncbi:LPS export ABC transporter periplasmic protein LptC [Stutzerimonas tarimensis]|uniref:Lipopolysaccharide export system protein LptC n=1 Tax=Stutzerimonas tarimensis TaxID=1507735 RepID=A0ABV7T6D4_9GAMM